MPTKLDLNTWNRKDHFHFFRQFEEPYFGVVVPVDCTNAYNISKEHGYSFFLYYLHCSLRAANEVENFRYRISGDEVLVHDVVHASPTINRPDGTFGFAYMDYEVDFEKFADKARMEIERIQNTSGLIPAMSGENVIHYSSIPWVNFTSRSHARLYSVNDSIPKISFGKMTEDAGKKQMPMSIHAHHALMDGYHTARYVDLFQNFLNADA